MSTYYLALHTSTDYDAESYDMYAGLLLQLMIATLSDRDTLHSLVTPPPVQTKCEIEVLLEPNASGRELVCRAVLDLQSERAKFDKAKFSKLIKAHEIAVHWPELKVAKRGV